MDAVWQIDQRIMVSKVSNSLLSFTVLDPHAQIGNPIGEIVRQLVEQLEFFVIESLRSAAAHYERPQYFSLNLKWKCRSRGVASRCYKFH